MFKFFRKGCNQALGLLGVLGLAAYLQNVLNQMAPAPANGGGRRRRGIQVENAGHIDNPNPPHSSLNSLNPAEKKMPMKSLQNQNTTIQDEGRQDIDIVSELLPVLSVVGHATSRLIPINCTFRSICKTNKKLVDKYGDVGRSVAAVISTEMGKMLMSPEPRRGPVTLRQVQKVAQIGRNGLPCNILFKDCEELSFLPNYLLPTNQNQDNGIPIPWGHPIFRKSGMAALLWPLQLRSTLLKGSIPQRRDGK